MGNETEKTSVKQLFQEMSKGNIVEVLQGVVISENPLKIQMINDEKLIIGANITYVPRHLTDYKTVVRLTVKPKQMAAIPIVVYMGRPVQQRIAMLWIPFIFMTWKSQCIMR